MVGGHCTRVDPYYLTHKAEATGSHPEIILAGRRLNDSMGAYVASQLIKAMLQQRIHVDGARVLVIGLTFNETCPGLLMDRHCVVPSRGSEFEHETSLQMTSAMLGSGYANLVFGACFADWAPQWSASTRVRPRSSSSRPLAGEYFR